MLNPELELYLVETIDDANRFMEWLRQPRRWLGMDTETGGLEWQEKELRVVQFGDLTAGWAIPVRWWRRLIEEAIRVEQSERIIFHNAKFDLHFLEANGFSVPRAKVEDSMLLSRVLDPHLPAGLKPASDRMIDSRMSHLQQDLNTAMAKGKWGWDTVPLELPQYWLYAALDPVLTVGIWEILFKRAGGILPRPYDIDMAVSKVILDMEQRGQGIDVDYCVGKGLAAEEYERQFTEWCQTTYGLENPGSDAQVIQVLRDQGCSLTKRTEKGAIALDKHVLESLGHPLATELINYRHISKMRTTYFDAWLRSSYGSDRIHPTFNISGARTARMSSERPNLQNVPRSRVVRNGLVPKEGYRLVLADYDQIELRLMAHFAEEQAMITAIHEGEDLHTYTAKLAYQVEEPTKEQRRVAKSANFAKIYGAGIAKFASTAGIEFDEAKEFLAGYDREFGGVREFQAKVANAAHVSAARSEDGLAHVYSEYMDRQQVVDPNQAYKLVNYLIQGTAADVLKVKLIELDSSGLGRYMTVPIHDEIAFEVPEDEVDDFVFKLPYVMEDRESFSVPLSVGIDVVDRWGDKYEEGT